MGSASGARRSDVVLEAVCALGVSDIATAIEMLLNPKALTLQDSDAVAVALEMFVKRPAVGFSDCLMLAIARKAGHLPLGTFDCDLGRFDGAEKL